MSVVNSLILASRLSLRCCHHNVMPTAKIGPTMTAMMLMISIYVVRASKVEGAVNMATGY